MPHQCTNCGHAFADGSKEMLSGCPECGGNTFQFHPGDVPEEPPSDADPPDDDTGVSGAVGRAANTVRDLVSRDSTPDSSPNPDAPPPGSSTPMSGAATDTGGASNPGAATGAGANSDTDAADPSAADPDATATDADADTDANAGSLGALTDREWPAVSRPDGPETDADGDDILDAEAADLAPPDADATPENTGEDRAQADARGSFVGPGLDSGSASSDAGADATAGDADTGGTDDIRVAEEDPDSVGEHSPGGDEGQPDLDALREELNEQFESIRIVEPGQYELNLMELYNREEYIIALQENGRYVIEVPDTWRD